MYVILLAAMLFVSATLAGIFAPPFQEGKVTPTSEKQYLCCDTGDGADCRAQEEKGTIQFKGDKYALLKSDVYLNEHKDDLTEEHLNPARDNNGKQIKINTPDQSQPQFVYVNPTEKRGGGSESDGREPECNIKPPEKNTGYDRLFGAPKDLPPDQKYGCYKIPDDLIIYLCRNDSPGGCGGNKLETTGTKFDIWIRLKDIRQGGELGKIPKVLTECFKPSITPPGPEKIVFRPSPGGQPNLQLRTFKFETPVVPVTWLSPYCKPAIYLYPERRSEINVSVFPQGKMLTTIPPYPKTGWDVVAEPNGDIYFQNKPFDYLYYEASLPDQLITPPSQGFIMNYDERALFLTDLVTKLGLNEKETRQFVDYWVPILPESPYYFVGIVPQDTLHEISPVLISPMPKNFLRITLYFKPLEEKFSVTPPLILPASRDGYTAVEWGGIFKQDKNHPFSCFM